MGSKGSAPTFRIRWEILKGKETPKAFKLQRHNIFHRMDNLPKRAARAEHNHFYSMKILHIAKQTQNLPEKLAKTM
jgi:hypothetical protein